MKYFMQILLSILFSVMGYAHPHMFVDVRPYFESISEDKILIHNKWYFDEFTSVGLYMDYDENQNQKLEKREIQAIEKDFVSGLKKYNYFLKIKLNGKKVIPKIYGFRIKVEKRKMKSINGIISSSKNKKEQIVNIIYYEFDIKISVKLKSDNKLSISYYDKTIYSVLSSKEKIITNKNLKITSNELIKKKCLFEVGFKI